MIHIVAFSLKGSELALKISKNLGMENRVFSKTSAVAEGTEQIRVPITEWAEKSFKEADGIIFVGATGIAVRTIAPYVKDKTTDPAVVCIDELGRNSISLLSGHIGGANDLAYTVSEITGANPVISTATDLNKKFSVDSFAVSRNMAISNMKLAKDVSAAVLHNERIGFKSDYPYTGNIPAGLVESEEPELGIYITSGNSSAFRKTLRLIPKNHVLEIGCRRNTPKEKIDNAVRKTLSENNISIKSIRMIASIDLKSDEVGLLEFSDELKVPIVFFTSDELNALQNGDFTVSEFVRKTTGVDCVCERSAVLASTDGKIVIRKIGLDGVTVAVAREPFEFNFGDE